MRKYEYGTIICECGCGEVIPDTVVHARAHNGTPPRFLNNEHMLRQRKESGFYSKKLSPAGLQAQRELQQASGKRPGREKRSIAAAKSNRAKPRKAKVKSI